MNALHPIAEVFELRKDVRKRDKVVAIGGEHSGHNAGDVGVHRVEDVILGHCSVPSVRLCLTTIEYQTTLL